MRSVQLVHVARLRKIFIRFNVFYAPSHAQPSPKPRLSRQVQVLREIVKVLAVLGVRLRSGERRD